MPRREDTRMALEHGHRPGPAAILLVPVVIAVVLTLFAWPSARLEPRDLPIGVAGVGAAAEALEQKLGAGGDAFDLQRYPDEASARRAIEDRDVYGAFVARRSGPKVLTASAASPAVAQSLSRAAGEGPQGAPVVVEDVVSAPRGAALASSVLPLMIAGLLAGVAAVVLTSNTLGRAGLLVLASILAGVVAATIVQSWLDVVGGDWLANAAVLGLTVLAISAFTAGMYALLGLAGIGLALVTMVFVGNPFSGVGSAPELLPTPVGALGQLMPPGAGGNLLRSTGYFDGADAGGHIAVLVVWAIGGVALLLAAGARRPATSLS